MSLSKRDREHKPATRGRGIHTAAEPLRVCVAVSHPLASRYIAEILEKDSELKLVSWSELQQNPKGAPAPQIILLDPSLLSNPLSQFLRNVRTNFAESKFLVLGSDTSESAILKLLFLGIHGFLTYDHLEETLGPVIRAVAAGNIWVPRQLLRRYVELSSRILEPNPRRADGLTRRESEILGLLLRRLVNKEIADALKISESTVKFHLSNIFEKFKVHDRTSLREILEQHRFVENLPELEPTRA